MLPNCPIAKADIIHAEEILGPNLGSLKRKMMRTKPSRVIIGTYDKLPTGILEKYGNVTLAVDIMYINEIPFVMTTSRAIHFGTADTGEAIEEETNAPTHGYDLWPRPMKRNQRYNMVSMGHQSTIAKPHLHVMLNQVGIREGLKMFGEKGNNTLLEELNQLHKRDALLPRKKEDMTYDESKKALRYLMFLKEKRDGTIKARGCADRRSQREYTTKAETSSPTISLKAMMMSCEIDAREGRHVAVTDIPGAFLHADMEEDVHMLLEGTIAEQIMKLDPSLYRKYTWEDRKGKLMLYVKLKKVLYRTLQAALLFWRLLSDTLVEWGFKLNEYDKCIANKKINGKQCTILWHVYNLKISHVDPKVVNDVVKKLEAKFGQEIPLVTSQGKTIEYLGMCINYMEKG